MENFTNEGNQVNPQKTSESPDVILDVPQLKVGKIKLEVENLNASIAVNAYLGNLIKIEVGAKVQIEKVNLDLESVEGEAHLKVRLDKIEEILTHALQTIKDNPLIMEKSFSGDCDAPNSKDITSDAGFPNVVKTHVNVHPKENNEIMR